MFQGFGVSPLQGESGGFDSHPVHKIPGQEKDLTAIGPEVLLRGLVCTSNLPMKVGNSFLIGEIGKHGLR